jgi:hypothetical protein
MGEFMTLHVRNHQDLRGTLTKNERYFSRFSQKLQEIMGHYYITPLLKEDRDPRVMIGKKSLFLHMIFSD